MSRQLILIEFKIEVQWIELLPIDHAASFYRIRNQEK